MLAHNGTAVEMIGDESLTSRAWYLIQCKASQDERAEINLTRQGYICFRPKHSRERVTRGLRKDVRESLFPSYMFIQLGSYDNWGPLRSTRGVSRIVSFGGKPLAVRDALIARLHERDSEATVQADFTYGETVRISDGPFAELEAIFLAMDGDERVVLLMNVLQREQRVCLPLTVVSRR
ncbi:transcription/translation regulatory transformer protein RfaH [Pseudomonas sp. MH9.2]|uniref:transcription/translation regulatory transformer protein RfaH n=1 Tax=unclassified Pseudomonas TaxID=196821 RepID=UPI002AC8BAAB|nr:MULTISPECIES: transcription/translation regulatory transformer protein RfaH [unclassified Pseudomonas]MEB0029057.1 transcription/translation regulatory transformer protein RfaH [Pseudomonas sp. MH9.2]MEB0150574.1 transcription/translation regulatory transformer protein RfaH [Pseudomonas sp. CCC2.2]MEE3509595.1 transcription/translation regulatory transformer protein RfaH [Pseudomonas sp. 10C3]WPX68883.1 transcription/translation regulatory transformer protein RfaH [Pseudomonas sp. MH9.2]